MALSLSDNMTSSTTTTSSSYLSNAVTAAQPLLHHWYNTTSGLWDTTGWWESANTLTTLGDLAFLDSSLKSVVTEIFTNTFHHAQSTYPGFLDEFYDDEAWWALAWINAYDLTDNPGYLSQASNIFTDLVKGYGTSPCGGMWWNKPHTQVNAIANALFLSVAAHLANRIPSNQTYYLNWARREYDWFLSSGLINKEYNINDGLSLSNCTNNNGTVWSYNQGVILGGLVELDRISPDPTYLTLAKSIADAAIQYLSTTHHPKGVLRDICDPTCDPTGTQFKGVFMRNLRRLVLVLPPSDQTHKFKTFIRTNADSIWKHARDVSNDTLGDAWTGPFGDASATSQSSALDALVAAAAVLGGKSSGTQDNGTEVTIAPSSPSSSSSSNPSTTTTTTSSSAAASSTRFDGYRIPLLAALQILWAMLSFLGG